MTFPVTPLGELIFVAPEPSVRGSRIVLSDERKSYRGRVLAAGPGIPLPDGSAIPMEVKVDDVVTYDRTTGIESVFDQRRVLIMRESDALTVEPAP